MLIRVVSPEPAQAMFDKLVAELKNKHVDAAKIQSGIFGAER